MNVFHIDLKLHDFYLNTKRDIFVQKMIMKVFPTTLLKTDFDFNIDNII